MTAEEQPSMSYILGLNQLADGQFNYESSETSEFLVGLNNLPLTNGEETPEDMSNLANQLALWTNANFSFDGPTGHALLGDDEKDNDPAAPNHHDEDESRVQRYAAASSVHSNAARDKNRERSEEARLPSNALHVPNGATEPLSQSWNPLATAAAPAAQPVIPGQPGVEPWDLTSTLALQYLLSRNNPAAAAAAVRATTPQAAAPQPAPQISPAASASAQGNTFAHLVQAAMSQPSSRSSSRAAEDRRPRDALETKAEPDVEIPAPSTSRRYGQSERVKLVDTGNPEADAEANRAAIEEDKRRRNTAASARFRIKKKQREAALELAARELETRVAELKQENERLRTENEWLKRLISGRHDSISLHHPPPPAPYLPHEQDTLNARHIFGGPAEGRKV
ncbi:hypothetical protein MCUN1_002865 [Malassezia cuniculi]|uniref:BZIP domain-containing protein n=1 Tax=Malassezia cuniculi TaxID=948313 RepID=A0AAF0EVN6_9BASI|nr:hypothetical protein MCUN1_002865 [Malassezia cuniculi]